MSEERVKTPVDEVTASISGLRIKDGTPNVIEFKVGIVLSTGTLPFIEYLAACLPMGAAVTVRRLIETFEEHEQRLPFEGDDDNQPGAGSFDFPGWPKACGLPVETYGMNTRCAEGHVGNTPRGEACAHIEQPVEPDALPFDEGDDANT